MNTEVRIGSYLAAIRCAEASDLQEIITKIDTDSNKQVQSFVFTHLNNLKETNWPVKEHLHKFLSNFNIPSTYQSNIFKYSKNIEVSYNTPVLGLGAAVDTGVVYEKDSYLPRLINLGLDMNLLGSFINIGEVGARVEGLDPIIKEVFGPESYLYKTPLRKIVQDSSLFIKQNGGGLFKQLENLIKQEGSFDVNALMQTVSKFLMANNIKLPKTDLYTKLMGQEFAFLSVAGPMQEVNINNVIETITSAVVDALVAAKDLNIDTVRAAHLHLHYSLPTIQGIPLKIKLEGTAVTGIQVLSKFESKANAHDAILKIIPSLNIAIDGHIGYGSVTKHGLKMKNSVYSTNGLAIYATLKNGKDFEVKFELPEKMELINVKSEVYLMTGNKMMDEVKLSTNAINDPRITEQHCSNLVEHITGLHVCYDVNIPNVISSKSLPLGLPVIFKVYLQKSDSNMKGYRIQATLKNKVDKKVLKMVAGTYGSAASAEASAKFTYTKEGNTYLTAADIKSAWLASNVEATFVHTTELVSLKLKADYKLNSGSPVAVACKFDIKNEEVANVKQYQISGFAGFTNSLTETHKLLDVKLRLMLNGGYTNAKLLAKAETLLLPITIGVELDVPTKSPWFMVVQKAELKVAVRKAIAFEGLILRKGAGQYLNSVKIHYYGSNIIEIEVSHDITGKLFENFSFITETKVMLGSQEIGTSFTVKHENSVIETIWELKNAGANIFIVNLKHIMEAKLYSTTIEVGLPTLPKTLKFNNVIEVVGFLNYKLITVVHLDNTALVHIEGPVSCQYGNAMMKYNIDLKIAGAFDGTIKFMHAALFSLEKTQLTIDMRHANTPLLFVDILADRTNVAEITAKAVIHLPIVLKAEYAAAINSGLIHTSMNTFVLPTTSLARRFKGYIDWNLKEQKVKVDFNWDAEKDNNKKLSFTTGYMVDTSMRKILVQGDLTLSTLAYGYKLETLLASPFEWFIGTSGIEFAVTAPSNKMFITKALCTVEHAESLVVIKPLLAFNTLNENKYEISGSLAAKKLPALWDFDISSQLTIAVPEMKKISVANKFLHEDKDGSCTITFKTGITGLYEPIALEISHEATVKGYTTMVKIENGARVSIVSSKIALITGLRAFDITIDAILPFTSVKSLAIRAAKTADGTATIIFSKNQLDLVKLHYIMASLYTHTISFECPSRTIELFASLNGNEMIVKVFPEKNLSTKMLETIVRVSKKTGSANIECFITAPSLANEIRIAAELALADPAKENLMSVNVQFPFAEFKKLLNVVVVELKKIHGDLVKDGLLPNITVLLKKLELLIRELPKYVNTLQIQILEIFTKYLTIVKNWTMKMWMLYEADVIAFLKNVQVELMRYWTILKIEVPIIFNEFMATLRKTELWKMLHGLFNKIINHFPAMFNILVDFYNKVVLTAVAEVKNVVHKIMTLPTFNFEAVWNILKTEVPAVVANLRTQLLNTELVTVVVIKVKEFAAHFPTVHKAVVDFWTHVIVPAYTDLVNMLKKFMKIQFTNVSVMITVFVEEILTVFNNFMTRLMNCEVVQMIITKCPTAYKAVVDFWTHVIVPAYADVVTMLKKLTKIQFTNVSERITVFVEEILTVFNNFMTHLMNCEVVQMIITNVKKIIKANPIIETLYATVLEVFNKTLVAFRDDLVMFYKRFMNFPMIKKLVDYILQILHSKDIRMAPLTWKSFTTVVHVFVTDVLGMTYTIAGNHFSTVVALPCSVSTLTNIWTSATTYLSAVVADVVNTWITVTETFPVAVATFKKHVFVMTEFIVEQIPITVKAIKSQVPKLINDLLPIINNFIEFLMNTEVFRFLMVKIEEVIIMYPAEFNAVKEFVENFIQFTFVTYNKMMEIPVIKKIVDYIWQLINRKDLHSSMVSSMSSVSSSVSSYTSSISSNVPLFVKLHTSSALSSWLASLAQ
ncbi:unnamed protein product [Meganyctiphanes norvegica]|uniref:Vitellinogen open beta-sheet domain-containing protein n=1 Tax=Meganyctiphanes norvegica TaxID=48144 RepID=A0AAV2R119_MEGNR